MSNHRRGSKWNKWDLHLHSPKTFLANQYNNCSNEEFVQAVFDAGLKAVGLTNYFCFHEEDLSIIKQSLNAKGIVVFPNIEFRTQPQNKENEEMHVHVLFSDKTPAAKIANFLGRLKTVDDKYCRDLTQAEIETTMITFDTLNSTLEADKDIRHFEDYLLIACPRGDGSFRPHSSDDGRGNGFAVVIDRKTDILFGKSDDTDFFLDTNRYEGAELKPVVCCSDAHSIDAIGTMFTWVKADPTFEGLKQILWEPRNRIKIQDRNPNNEKPARTVIDRLVYRDESGSDREVLLNKGLNSIIGVRGSGKSTLLKNIVFAVDGDQFNQKDSAARLYKLNRFKAYWGDGHTNAGADESPKSIFYIPQNYLSSLAYEESGRANERDKFLTDLLKKNAKFANGIRAYYDFVSDSKVKIESFVENLLKANQALLESQSQLRKLGSRKEINEEVEKINEEIKKYQSKDNQTLSEQEITSYMAAKQAVEENVKVIAILEQDKNILQNLLDVGADVFISNQEISRLSSERQLVLRSELIKKSRENLKLLIQDELIKINSDIIKAKELIANNQKVLSSLDDRIKANKAMELLAKELGKLRQTLKEIGELEVEIAQSADKKAVAIDALVNTYISFDMQQKAIFSTIEFDVDFSFLQIDIITYFNLNDLKKFVERHINTVSTSPHLGSDDNDVRVLLSDAPEKPSPETIRKCINKLIDGQIKLKVDAGEIGDIISLLLKDRYEIDYLNSVKTKEDGTLFKNMTGGQKAIGMLELVFRFDNERYPILIDQPEDDLDVSGIATDLVNFIKLEKDDRQIIIVSHNGSLVICADTEEVLVADNNRLPGGYSFIYSTGGIENPEIRGHIIRVLEGGKEALKQRARKLDFKHEI